MGPRVSYTTKLYLWFSRVTGHRTDPVIKKRKVYANPKKGKGSFIQGCRDFAKGLKKL